MNELELIDTPQADAPPRAVAVATPAMLLQIAVERGADMAYVEKLMQLQERHEANEARNAHNEAVAAFKSEAITIVKGKRITDGPLKGKSHADLFDVVSAVTPALSKHGLSISWKLTKDEKDWIEVTCFLKHSAGHAETVSMGGAPDTGPGRNAIQARCSVKTYLERYTALAILGMAAADADDEGAGGRMASAISALLTGLEALTTDADALAYWKHHRETLRNDMAAYDRFTKAVAEHRRKLGSKA